MPRCPKGHCCIEMGFGIIETGFGILGSPAGYPKVAWLEIFGTLFHWISGRGRTPGPPRSSGTAENQTRPILTPFRGAQKIPPDCLQIPSMRFVHPRCTYLWLSRICRFRGLGGHGRPENLPKRWRALPPTFLEGFPAARCCPHPQQSTISGRPENHTSKTKV